MLLRAVGPLHASGREPRRRVVTSNDNWRESPERAGIEATGIPPGDDREAAILRTLAPSAYTAILRGKNDSTGIALVEIYDRGISGNAILANISSRGVVETGDNAMIGGFIAGHQTATTNILVRGIGPSMKEPAPERTRGSDA